MLSSNIFLTRTFVDKDKLSKLIAYNYFEAKTDFQVFFEKQKEVSEEVEQSWQYNLNARRIIETDFQGKDEFSAKLMEMYQTYNEQTLLFLGDLSEYSLPLQEGMLRILEEPPTNLQIILYAKSKNNILPTIVSRCGFHLLPEPFVLQNLEQNLLEKVKKKLPEIATTVKTLASRPDSFQLPDLKTVEREELDFWLWQIGYYLEAVYRKNQTYQISALIEKIRTAQNLNHQNLQKKFILGSLKI
jgi:hypothetical protein